MRRTGISYIDSTHIAAHCDISLNRREAIVLSTPRITLLERISSSISVCEVLSVCDNCCPCVDITFAVADKPTCVVNRLLRQWALDQHGLMRSDDRSMSASAP